MRKIEIGKKGEIQKKIKENAKIVFYFLYKCLRLANQQNECFEEGLGIRCKIRWTTFSILRF